MMFVVFLFVASGVCVVLAGLAYLADRGDVDTVVDIPSRVVTWCDKNGHYFVFSDRWHCIHCGQGVNGKVGSDVD
jgi:hypothetical protein